MAGRKKFQTQHEDDFVSRLETVREALHYSQQRMAKALGVPFRTYQKWVYAGQKPRHRAAILARVEGMQAPRRTNCWEVLQCGRGPKGDKVKKEGLCAVAADAGADGVNSGTNGGRVCWGIPRSSCDSKMSGPDAMRMVSCLACDFFRQVLKEEGLANFKLLKPGQSYVQT